MPKTSAPDFDAKLLETLALADFVDLSRLEFQSAEAPLEAEPKFTVEAARREMQTEFDAFARSRFRFLVAHLNPQASLAETLLIGDLVNFVGMLRELFSAFAALTAKGSPGVLVHCLLNIPLICVVDPGTKKLARRPSFSPAALLLDRLRKLLDGADPSRFRHCESPSCNRLFYAKRADQRCCSGRCNNNRLQRKWYAEHGKSVKYSQGNRTKPQKTARSTSTNQTIGRGHGRI